MKRDVLVTSLVKQKAVQKPAVDRSKESLWRLEHLESQMAKLFRFGPRACGRCRSIGAHCGRGS